ncbi:MAG: zinc ribbon domain-containing protein [Anaerolineae bacterium]|nr:MAG: zinc ribbon domain-containing protein [Anaerolineae bacterium]
METRIFHGNISPNDLASALVSRFNRGNLTAQVARTAQHHIVQISSMLNPRSGGSTALGVTIHPHEDGIVVSLGKQAWLGIAASLGATLLAAKHNPFNLLGRLDDIAQDIENLTLDEQVWQVIEEISASFGASRQISDRLRRTGCPYCGSANQTGASRCEACGAPLGEMIPLACGHCGYVLAGNETVCPNCKEPVSEY